MLNHFNKTLNKLCFTSCLFINNSSILCWHSHKQNQIKSIQNHSVPRLSCDLAFGSYNPCFATKAWLM